MDFVAIDFETANEQRDSACAIGLAFVERGQIVRTWQSLMRPAELRFNGYNTRIHGIDEDDVRDKPTIAQLWPDITRMISGLPLIAHSASFDMSVLRASLASHDMQVDSIDYLCSHKIAREVWPCLESYRLSSLARRFGIPLRHHQADSDAQAAAELTLLAAKQVECNNVQEFPGRLGVSIGRILAVDKWIPSSQIRIARECLRLDLPDGYDISSHPFYGKRIKITGTLDLCTKLQAHAALEQVGGIPKGNVSKKTDFVVTGEQDLWKLAEGSTESRSLQAAKALIERNECGIQIISDEEFMKMLLGTV